MSKSRIALGVVLCAALIGGAASGAKAGRKCQRQEASEPGSRTTTAAAGVREDLGGQRANKWDMDGHAAKAKELLEQVNRELKEAAEAANKNHK
jgi:hypothetical protein